MATKGRAKGYGSEGTYAHINVFKVSFNHPLSSKVRYECYDNDQTYPAVDDNNTAVAHNVFGVWGTSLSMIALRDTTNGAGAATMNWFPAATAANTATINRMKGLTWYVTQQGATLSTSPGSLYFNMQVEVPATSQTSWNMQFDLQLRYTFTSTTPTLTWYFNQVVGGTAGTGTVPVFATMPPGTWGIRHCRAGTAEAGPYLANIPATGVELTEESWITNS
jgi:hypothetical protein